MAIGATLLAILFGASALIGPAEDDLGDRFLFLGIYGSLAVLMGYGALEYAYTRLEIEEEGISSRVAWRPRRFVAWTAIQEINWNATWKWFVIRGAKGGAIRASLGLSGIRELQQELERRVPANRWRNPGPTIDTSHVSQLSPRKLRRQRAPAQDARADVSDQGCFRVSAALAWKLPISTLGFGMGVFTAGIFVSDRQNFSPLMRFLGPSVAAFIILGTIEQLQRVFVFYPDKVRIRIMWLWRTILLPPRLTISVSEHGEVILADATTGRRCLRITREYTRSGRLATELETYYGG